MEEQQGKVCPKCKIWKPMEEFGNDKHTKDGKCSNCKECRKRYRENNKEKISEYHKEYKKKNKEKIKEYNEKNKEHQKQYRREYYLENKEKAIAKAKEYYEENKEKILDDKKKYREENKKKISEWQKEYQKNNGEKLKEYRMKYYKENREKFLEERRKYVKKNNEIIVIKRKAWNQANKEKIAIRDKKYRERIRKENIQKITKMLEMIKPIFAELNLPVYGTIYKITNIKTNRSYIGQTTSSLNQRYSGDVIKTWLNERNGKPTQKFKDELTNKEDFVYEEMLNVGCCKYHLNQLEAYYIDYYNSYEDGYNNNGGPHDDNDGFEEFVEMLQRYNIEFVDDELRKK